MALQLPALGFVLLVLGGFAYQSPTHLHFFDVEEYGEHQVEFSRHTFYGLLGPDGHICMNLTTTGAVKVFLGSCNEFVLLGKFSSGYVPMGKSFLSRAMELSRTGESCRRHSLGLKVQTSYYESYGEFNFFKCYQEVSRTAPNRRNPKPIETSTFKIVPRTWMDRYQEFAFEVAAGDIARHRIDMRTMIDAAAIDSSSTVCFNLTGASRIMLTLSRCKNSADFRVYITDEKVTGLNLEDTERMDKLLHHKCPNEKKTHAWHLTIDGKGEELSSGSVAVYSCREVVAKNRVKYENNAKIMGFERQFYFSVQKFSTAVYSADLKGMMDYATFGKSNGFKVIVDMEATAPVSIYVGRCMNKKSAAFDDHLIIADRTDNLTDTLYYEDLMVLQSLAAEPKCDERDSDEALYLTVLTASDRAVGSIFFTLVHEDGPHEFYQRVKSAVMFTAPKEMTVSKSLALEHVFDEGLMNSHMIGFEINSTSNVNLFISKCRYSPRQALVRNGDTGLYEIRYNHQVSMFDLFEGPNCGGQDGENYTLGYLHVQALTAEAKGFVRFVTLNNGTKLKTKKFVDLTSEHMATPHNNQVTATFNESQVSNEIDLRYFVEAVRSEPELSLYVEHNYPTDVTVYFTKCMASLKHSFSVVLSQKHRFSPREISKLRYIMKSERCDNVAKYGVFAYVAGHQNDGALTFTFGKYGRKLRRNEYIMKRDH